MTKLLNHATVSEVEFTFTNGLLPVEVIYTDSGPNSLRLSNDEFIQSSCLNCDSKGCLKFSPAAYSDIVDVVFAPDVCPTNSLYLDEYEQVTVDEASCIGCGLCASRCPTGAIYLHEDKAIIHRDNTHLEEGQLTPELDITYTGELAADVEEKTTNIISSICSLTKAHLVTNNLIKGCFMALGFKVIKPRVGDVNLRMDLILDSGEKLYLVEVDGFGTPDTVRDIIDDVAIFSDKYKKDLETLSGVSCLFLFPNKRSEYYELISDTENVLNFNIYSVSLGVLLANLFARNKLTIDAYNINEGMTSCRAALDKSLGHACGFGVKSSLIEAAK